MLKGRVITALALALVALYVVWFAPSVIVLAAFVAVAVLAAWEWGRLCGLESLGRRALFAAMVAAGLGGGWWLVLAPVDALPIALACAAAWFVALARLLRYLGGDTGRQPQAAALISAAALLVTAWLAMVLPFARSEIGPYWLTALFIVVWGSDIGGYFAGRRWGRRRLAPGVSPGKTWEGAAGGLALAVAGLASLIGGLGLVGYFQGAPPWWHLLAAPPLVAVAILGDLYESMLKRQAGVKDSGTLVPGHGGVLDRVDALMMAAPGVALLAFLGGG